MPAKKATAKATPSSEMNMDTIWKWLYALGTLAAGILGGLAFQNPIITWVLIVIGVLVGWFYFDAEELGQFGLRVLALWVAREGLSLVPFGVGTFITGFVSGWLGFLYPVVLAMGFHFLWKRRLATLFESS